MPVIGLTGGIASGKSLVTRFLEELGAAIVDADVVARQVVEPGTRGWTKLIEVFGEKILKPDRTIDRKALGTLVFNDPDQMERLNAITHPLITEKIKRQIKEFRENPIAQVMVIDAPLLIETGLHRLVDEIWVVDVPDEIRINRLMVRDGLTRDQALKRIRSQMPVEEKKEYAAVIVDNSGDRQKTREAVVQLWKKRFKESGVESIGT